MRTEPGFDLRQPGQSLASRSPNEQPECRRTLTYIKFRTSCFVRWQRAAHQGACFKTAVNLHNWVGFVLIDNFFVWLLFHFIFFVCLYFRTGLSSGCWSPARPYYRQ